MYPKNVCFKYASYNMQFVPVCLLNLYIGYYDEGIIVFLFLYVFFLPRTFFKLRTSFVFI